MSFLKPLSGSDGSWQQLKDDWQRQCAEAEEDFESYISGTFSVLEGLAVNPEARAGVYAYVRDGVHEALCQVNCTPLPGYDGPVLRTRFMTLSPRFDFEDLSVDEYARVLVNLFLGVIDLSAIDGPFRARHIKFHLPSPADRHFFASFGTELHAVPIFESVRMQGGWLYVTKNQ
jgi:hypothetical protein